MPRSDRLVLIGVTAAVGVLFLAAVAVIIFFSQRWAIRDRPPHSGVSMRPRVVPTHTPDVVDDALTPTDWPRFRGPHGLCVAVDATVPLVWSDTENVRWKTDLPGPGSASPIVVGDRVLVTCYSGYGTDAADSDDVKDLKRHLVCLNRSDGEIAWTVDIEAVVPEDPYRGYLTEHGYASHTPVSDGKAVYAFFGKSGVVACDLDGSRLWHTSVGTQSDSMRWGSAASPVLCDNLVIVNASSESRSIRALDKRTGEEVWNAPAESLDLSFGTPTVVDLPDGRKELVLCVPGELWGLAADAGTLNWYATVPMTGNLSPSVSVHDGIIYATGGYRGKGTVAVALGGEGDVTETNIRWSIRPSTYVPSPVWYDEHLYWVDDKGVAVCLNAETGEVVYQERVPLEGRGGRSVYASPLLVGDKLIVVTRIAGTVILAARPEFEVLGTNILSDQSEFNATPAIAGDQLFLRSNRAMYCISAETTGQ